MLRTVTTSSAFVLSDLEFCFCPDPVILAGSMTGKSPRSLVQGVKPHTKTEGKGTMAGFVIV
ncbi:hypothetical protein FACS1894172_14570 [Spirochaetia bacterium]|nr:hypothetical protein FACS1894164_01380 [Spirochaetia bacterium]GHU34386.1 hypothetical protein FACS1894172_14570 [Spirochaetia bacterium]